MMDTEALELAKRACLKQSFGGSLDDQEQELFDQYLATEEGRAYLDESKEVQRLLSEVAEVNVNQDVDSKAMIASFEAMARDDMRKLQPWLPLALLLCPGALIGIGLYCLRRSGDLEFLGWALVAWGTLFSLLFLALWKKQGAMLEDPNLFASLEEDRRLSQSRPVMWRSLAMIAVLYATIGVGVAKAGGVLVLSIALVTTVIFSCWFHREVQTRLRKHEEFWNWWDGRETQP